MALDFPSSPTTGQTYTGSDGTQWKWDGAKWVSAQQAIAFPITIPQGGTGAITAPAALTALGAQPIVGTTTNNNAVAGQLGEYVTVLLPQGTPQNVGGSTWTGVMSMNLSPGDWDVWGELWILIDAGTTVTAVGAFINQTGGAPPVNTVNDGQSGGWLYATAGGTFPVGVGLTYPMAPFRMSIGVVTPAVVWCYALITAGSPIHLYGKLCARRVR